MVRQFFLLLIVYGGLSVAVLLLLGIGVAIARTRLEVRVVGVICGALVAIHAAELVYLGSLGKMWIGDGVDPLLVAGAALMLLAGGATALFVRHRGRAVQLSGGTR
jgi:hypothetical protein